MKLSLFTSILSATGLLALASDPAPQMTDISQKAAKPGEIIIVSGQGLNSKNIDEIYLTDHKFDMRVKVLEQTQTTVKFRVPPFAKPGRTQLLFLTKGDEPKLLEQPVYLLIEDPETEVASVKLPPEPGKQEAATTAETKPEVSSADPSKPEPPSQQVHIEQTASADPANLDHPKLDQLKPVLAKPDLTKPDLSKPDATKPDLAKQDPRQPNV
jgi:hypothetical protein